MKIKEDYKEFDLSLEEVKKIKEKGKPFPEGGVLPKGSEKYLDEEEKEAWKWGWHGVLKYW